MAEEIETFTFHPLAGDASKLPTLEDKNVKELLSKWDLVNNMRVQKFRYDQFFKASHHADRFFVDLLNDPEFRDGFQVMDARGNWVPFTGKVGHVTQEQLKSTVITMDFFDRIYEHGLVREGGNIKKCFDIYLDDGIVIADRLRECLLCSGDDDPSYIGSELSEVFDEEDRREFIYHVLKRIAVGGSMNQYEDNVEAYLNTTKSLYKDLVSVAKNQATGRPEVLSSVFRIHDVDGEGDSSVSSLFPRKSYNNFFYVSVDPVRRHITTWYYAFIPIL